MRENILEKSNLKPTKNRKEILSIVKIASSPLSANDIYNECFKRLNINLSTVYRTLDKLTTKGILLKTLRQDGISYYQINDNTHKHYLVCNRCKEVIAIDKCSFNLEEKEIEKSTGYQITGHNIEITGICPKCINKLK